MLFDRTGPIFGDLLRCKCGARAYAIVQSDGVYYTCQTRDKCKYETLIEENHLLEHVLGTIAAGANQASPAWPDATGLAPDDRAALKARLSTQIEQIVITGGEIDEITLS